MQITKKERESNIELLRIVSICGVIILHYNNRLYGNALSLVPQGSLNEWVLYVLEAVFIASVNLFILISGFFSIKSDRRDLIKPLGLVLQVIICSELIYLVNIMLGKDVLTIKSVIEHLIPANYFVMQYAALYIISPLINKALSTYTDKRQLERISIVLILLLSVEPTIVDALQNIFHVKFMGLSVVGAYGSQEGYSLINFILMYFLGAIINLLEIKVSLRKAVILLTINTAVITVWSRYDDMTALEYCNPFVIAEAVLLFSVFANFKIKSGIINSLSKGCFMCFLIHMSFLPYLNVENAVNSNVLVMLSHILISCIVLFLIGYICNQVYSFIINPILRPLEGKFII